MLSIGLWRSDVGFWVLVVWCGRSDGRVLMYILLAALLLPVGAHRDQPTPALSHCYTMFKPGAVKDFTDESPR